MQDVEREFKPTSWAIDNKVSIYVAIVIDMYRSVFTNTIRCRRKTFQK